MTMDEVIEGLGQHTLRRSLGASVAASVTPFLVSS